MIEPTEIETSARQAKVLITDDDIGQRLILKNSLESNGYQVYEAGDGKQAAEILDAEPDIRLLLTDLAMPEMDGFELVRHVRTREMRYTYIIVLTSIDDRESLIKALSLGADDYLTKPVFPDELKLRLQNGTRLLRLESQEALIFSMAKLAEYRSEETGYHLERVAYYTRLLARDLVRYNPEYRLTISMADEIALVSPLHDLGKVAIPDHILHKPGRLTEDECEIMKTHTSIGSKFIREIFDKTGSQYLWLGYEIARFHHERWDGRGYPDGLAGEAIPVSAQVMAIADVYDALTSKRCYKDAFTHEKTKSIILEGRSSQFDPRVVDAFVRNEDTFLDVKKRFQDN
jgi:putative two-component system response regulator